MVITTISLITNFFLTSYILHNKNQKTPIIKTIPQKRIRYSWQMSKQSDRDSKRKFATDIALECESLKPPEEANNEETQ